MTHAHTVHPVKEYMRCFCTEALRFVLHSCTGHSKQHIMYNATIDGYTAETEVMVAIAVAVHRYVCCYRRFK
jgi:hypothetical protein